MSYIDDIMGFNPQNLEAFQEPVSNNNYDVNIYKTNPVKLSKSEDGHYRSKIRIIYNPFDVKKSIVPQATYYLKDADGSILVRSKLANGDKSCPIFTAWKKLWFAHETDPQQQQKKTWAREMFDKTESQWCLIQVLEDENQPELVGKILAWKLPKAIFNKMSAKMNPSPESKKAPVPVMDYLMGLPLDLDVTPGPDDPSAPERKQREISYDLCDFDTEYAPIIKVDGTPLFEESELETIDAYVTAREESVKGKTAAKKEAAQKTMEGLKEQIKTLYQKSLDYLKENSFDLVQECGYQEWDDALKARIQNWIDCVLQLQNPQTTVVMKKEIVTPVPEDPDNDVFDMMATAADVASGNEDAENLPF